MKKQAKKRDLRILWSSNGWWTNSGYGVFTRDILWRMVKDKWPVAHIAFWGQDGHPHYDIPKDKDGNWWKEEWKGLELKVYPKMDHPYGADALVAHALDYKADMVFTMQDIPMLDPQYLSQLKYWVPYIPIDKDPVPPGVLNNLRYAYKIVTFSKFGQDTLLKAGFTSTLILEGTDPDLLEPMDKAQCRKDFGLPEDAFIFGMIAANKENPPRKGFQEALDAFKVFSDKHPEARLFIHTQQRTPGGFPVEDYSKHLGFQDKLLLLQPYQAVFNSDSRRIAKEMNAMDVLLHPSRTEGFGLTVIEALSCGVPVIVNNTTSMPEMIQEGVTGFICDSRKDGWWTPDGSYTYSADVQSLYEKMEASYSLVSQKSKETSKACRDFVIKNYNIDTLYETKWKPFLEELQEEILPLQTPKQDVQLNQLNTPIPAGQ